MCDLGGNAAEALPQELSQAGQRVVGASEVRRALLRGCVTAVYLAEDAEGSLTTPLLELCSEHQVPVERVPSMEALGQACGIPVKAAVAAVLKR